MLGREPDIFIPSDREIPRAVNEGVPIVLARPESESAVAFGTLAEMYTGKSSSTVATPTVEKRSSLFSRRAGKKV